jgi:hypothetical protein
MRRDLSEANYTASACGWTTRAPGNRRLNRAPPAGGIAYPQVTTVFQDGLPGEG